MGSTPIADHALLPHSHSAALVSRGGRSSGYPGADSEAVTVPAYRPGGIRVKVEMTSGRLAGSH